MKMHVGVPPDILERSFEELTDLGDGLFRVREREYYVVSEETYNPVEGPYETECDDEDDDI